MPRDELYCQGDAAAHFYHLAAKLKAALFRQEIGSADIAAAFIDQWCSICEILVVVEDVDVHQIVNQLLGSVATS